MKRFTHKAGSHTARIAMALLGPLLARAHSFRPSSYDESRLRGPTTPEKEAARTTTST